MKRIKSRRNFIFEKQCEIVYEEAKPIKFCINLIISNEDRPKFTITTSCDTIKQLEKFGLSFLKNIYEKIDVQEIEKNLKGTECKYEIVDRSERSVIEC